MLHDRRLWGLVFLVLVLVPAFLLLSRWQLSRLDERRAENAAVTAHADSTPVPVTEVMTAGADPSTIGDDQQWREVTATGRYDDGATQLVRQRPQDGTNGYWVVTPLVLPDGSVLAVNRGWVAAGADAVTSPPVPAAPAGTVTVVGRIRTSETAGARPPDLPQGQVTALDVRALDVHGPAFPGYVELVGSDPAEAGTPALAPVPLPELDDGPHLSYAVQWVLFAVIAVVGLVIIVRGEFVRARDDEEGDEDGDPAP